MDKLSILVQLEAKPGKEHEVEQFLKSALPLVQAETGTTTWYALKMGPSKAEDLFAKPPAIEQPEILASKAPRA
jgi:hypothetical protein